MADSGEEFENELAEEHDEEERAQLLRAMRLERRTIRDMVDPIRGRTVEAFTRRYRLTQNLFLFFKDDVMTPVMRVRTSPCAVPLERKLLCALRFFASGSYQLPVGDTADVSAAQQTVSNIIEEVVTAMLTPQVLGRFIRMPRTRQEAQVIIERNRAVGTRLPDVVAFADGSLRGYYGRPLIRILKPTLQDNVQAFIGRKSEACLNAHFVCDKSLKILNINARYPGATNDSFIWSMSAVRTRMKELHAERPCNVLGDSAYPQEPWLMTPFCRNEEPADNTPEARYNRHHACDRNAVERCIGLLKMQWRCCMCHRVLHYRPVKAGRIITCCAILHNICVTGHEGYLHRDWRDLRNNLHRNDVPDIPERDILVRGRAERRRIVEILEARRR